MRPDPLRLAQLNALDKQVTEEGLADALFAVEAMLPIAATIPEVPYFALTPPVLAPPSRWPALLDGCGLESDALVRLLQSGFMPLDRQLLVRRTGGDDFFSLLTDRRFIPLDVDYGIAPYAQDSPVWANLGFARPTIERYAAEYPEIARNRNSFLSLGGVRLGRTYPPMTRRATHPFALEVRVESRIELERLVAALQLRSGGEGYQPWFRGQATDYLLGDFPAEVSSGFCPWRGWRDSSLIPSLYRILPRLLGDRTRYLRFIREYAMASMFLDVDLDIPESNRRDAESPREKINADWYRRFPMPSAVRSADGMRTSLYLRRPDTADELDAHGQIIHDYHPIYRGLQQMFFFQHYGLPSNLLDLTSSLDVALFFAQNRVHGNRMVPVDRATDKPVLLVFLLRPDLDVFIESSQLAERFGLLRPQRQHCGVLAGASMIHRNDYARYIAMKIVLDRPIPYNGLTAEYLFPDEREDPFLGRLRQFADASGLNEMKPWILDPSPS